MRRSTFPGHGPSLRSGDSVTYLSRETIAKLVRRLREDVGLTQDQFAGELQQQGETSPSRYTVLRIEKGHLELGQDFAARLDEWMARDHKGAVADGIATFLELVRRDHRIDPFSFTELVDEVDDETTAYVHGKDIARLLKARGLHELCVVLCDDFDIASLIESFLAAESLDITLVLPSRARLDQLFNTDQLRSEYVEHLQRHIQSQGRRLQRLAGRSKGINLKVFISDVVLNSVIVTKYSQNGRVGSDCAYWPCLPSSGSSGLDGIRSSVGGSEIANWYRRLIETWIDTDLQVARRQIIGDVFLVQDKNSTDLRFGRLRPRKNLKDYIPGDEGEGLAVAMIWPIFSMIKHGTAIRHTLFERRPRIAKDGTMLPGHTLSLLNARVTADDVLKALPSAEDKPANEHVLEKNVRDMALSIVEMLETEASEEEDKQRYTVRLLDRAYRSAARTELRLMFGLDVDNERLVPVDLEPFSRVRVIDKGHPEEDVSVLIYPRLFGLNLNNQEVEVIESARSRFDTSIRKLSIDSLRTELEDEVAKQGDVTAQGYKFDDLLRHAMSRDPDDNSLIDRIEDDLTESDERETS